MKRVLKLFIFLFVFLLMGCFFVHPVYINNSINHKIGLYREGGYVGEIPSDTIIEVGQIMNDAGGKDFQTLFVAATEEKVIFSKCVSWNELEGQEWALTIMDQGDTATKALERFVCALMSPKEGDTIKLDWTSQDTLIILTHFGAPEKGKWNELYKNNLLTEDIKKAYEAYLNTENFKKFRDKLRKYVLKLFETDKLSYGKWR
ncbi:MAG: hypothetical protein WC614_08480 [bacterium]